MNDPKFVAGDVVIAVVGGRQMTVQGYTSDGRVVCRWFQALSLASNSNQLQEAAFSEAVLKKVD